MFYQDIENGKMRNLTPEEVCAMYHFHDEYARLGIGAIAFYANLSEGDKNFIERMVKDIVKQNVPHKPRGIAAGKDFNYMLSQQIKKD